MEIGFASLHQDSNDALDINDVANGHKRPSQPAASIELEAECQIEKSFHEYSMDSDNDRPRRKPKKHRFLSDIYKELGSCIGWTEGSEFPTDTQNYSDNDITLGTFIRGKKRVPATSKKSGALKNKRKTARVVEPILDQAKRSKPVSDDSLGNDSHPGSIYNLRKNRAVKPDLQPTDKAAANDRPRRKPQKHRLLSDIYKDLGSCIGGGEGNVEREFTTDTEYYSDDITLGTFIREKKCVQDTSKNSSALKKKSKIPQVVDPRLDQAKRSSKPVSDSSLGNDSDILGCRYNLRKNRIIKLDFLTADKNKKSSVKARRSCVAQKAKGVSNLCDGNQKHFTEHGSKSAQLIQPTTAISKKNMETAASGSVQKRITESSPLSDYESMAALQLLRLFNDGVNRKTSSKTTATKDGALSVTTPKSLYGLNGVVQLSSGSVACEERLVEVNIISSAGLPEQTESETYICRMSRNPAEFSTPNAKKFMRRV